jgi:hypothetical protein
MSALTCDDAAKFPLSTWWSLSLSGVKEGVKGEVVRLLSLERL